MAVKITKERALQLLSTKKNELLSHRAHDVWAMGVENLIGQLFPLSGEFKIDQFQDLIESFEFISEFDREERAAAQKFVQQLIDEVLEFGLEKAPREKLRLVNSVEFWGLLFAALGIGITIGMAIGGSK